MSELDYKIIQFRKRNNRDPTSIMMHPETWKEIVSSEPSFHKQGQIPKNVNEDECTYRGVPVWKSKIDVNEGEFVLF